MAYCSYIDKNILCLFILYHLYQLYSHFEAIMYLNILVILLSAGKLVSIQTAPSMAISPIIHSSTLRPGQNVQLFPDDISSSFSWMKILIFWLKFHQAIIWTNAGFISWSIYASLDLSELVDSIVVVWTMLCYFSYGNEMKPDRSKWNNCLGILYTGADTIVSGLCHLGCHFLRITYSILDLFCCWFRKKLTILV